VTTLDRLDGGGKGEPSVVARIEERLKEVTRG
jgi:hypothetical protein